MERVSGRAGTGKTRERLVAVTLTVSQNGMRSFQTQINQISDNLANMQTPGFQAQLTEQQALNHQSGSRTIQSSLKITPGPIKRTDRSLDLSLEGNQFFPVETDTGRGFLRSGRFQRDREGKHHPCRIGSSSPWSRGASTD